MLSLEEQGRDVKGRKLAERLADFLADLWGDGESWAVLWLRGPDGDWRLRRGEDLVKIAEEIGVKRGDWYFAPHAYHPRGGRTDDNIVQLNGVVVDLDSGDLEEAKAALRERGLRPHYVINTSPGHYQLILRELPIRLGKRNREAVLKRQGDVIQRLYEIAGGDMAAAKVNQLFRLPGSRRQLEDGVWRVSIIEESEHPPYSLRRLERAVSGNRRSTFRGYRPAEDLEQRRNGNGARVLSSPALQWLQDHIIAEGFRNTALVAMTYAAAMDGLSYEEARPRLLQWVAEHTDGPYPRHEAEAVIRSCYQNPKGLDWRVLATIQDVHGETMTDEQAKSVLKFMPRAKQVHERLPLEELRNRPLFESVGKVLKALAELQLKRPDRRPVEITTEELAEKASVPLGTMWTRVVPALNAMGVRAIKRRGRSSTSTYDLRMLSPAVYKHYAFVDAPTVSALFRRSPSKVIGYWAWRFRELWNAFIALLKRLVSIFTGHREEAAGVYRVNERGRRLRRREARGPPRRVTDVRNEAVFWTLSREGVCPVLPKHQERGRERLERQWRLLQEWRSLSTAEKARRRRARLEIARQWLEEARARTLPPAEGDLRLQPVAGVQPLGVDSGPLRLNATRMRVGSGGGG